MTNYVFMLEEQSMEIFLEKLLPRFFPEMKFKCIAHSGKNDLQKSIPKKLKAWQDKESKFIIIRDNDNATPGSIENLLGSICKNNKNHNNNETIIHLAYQELESWFLGDLKALEECYGKLSVNNTQKKFRTPDKLGSPSKEIKKIIPSYQKLDGAGRIGNVLSKDNNLSDSYNLLISRLDKLVARQ